MLPYQTTLSPNITLPDHTHSPNITPPDYKLSLYYPTAAHISISLHVLQKSMDICNTECLLGSQGLCSVMLNNNFMSVR